MTSSLVGSEMCIRDSLRNPPGTRPCRTMLRVEARGGDPAAQPTLSVAVSYTHLTLPTICSV
eukprot:2262526-Prorocentrum_lima.AAC.1